MLAKFAVALATAALVAAGLGPATAGAKSRTAGACTGAYVVASDAASLAKASAALLCLVNRERAARGLGAMRASDQLASAATGHSSEMVADKYFSHTSLDGAGVAQRVSRTGYDWMAVGETLAFGAGKRATPFRLMATMMQSPVHRPILLGRYRELGVGLVLGAPTAAAVPAASTLTLVFGSR
jgi:uncharacterized protein YkwD